MQMYKAKQEDGGTLRKLDHKENYVSCNLNTLHCKENELS